MISLYPVVAGVVGGCLVALLMGDLNFAIIDAPWFSVPRFVFPNFLASESYEYSFALAALALATVAESVGHLNQIGVYTNKLARDRGLPEPHVEKKTGLNLIADGCADLVSSFGGCAPLTNYGESISICNITRCYSTAVICVSAIISILIAFCGKVPALVDMIPEAVIGGMSIYMFGLISMQGLTLMSEEKVDFFDKKVMSVVGVMLILGLSGYSLNLGFVVLPSVVLATIVGIILNLLLTALEKRHDVHNMRV